MASKSKRTAPGGGVITQFPTRAEAVTPSDTTEYDLGIAVYVGGAGDVVVEPFHGGNTVTFSPSAGDMLPVLCRRVLATGTTATDIKGIY